MLKFEEKDRPSFVELAKLVLTSTENSLDSPKGEAGLGGKKMSKPNNMAMGNANASKSIELQNKKVSKTFSMQNFNEKDGTPDGNEQVSAAAASMEKGQIRNKVIDTTQSHQPNATHEES